MGKIGSVLHGVLGTGAVLLTILRACDHQASRGVRVVEHIPTETVTRAVEHIPAKTVTRTVEHSSTETVTRTIDDIPVARLASSSAYNSAPRENVIMPLDGFLYDSNYVKQLPLTADSDVLLKVAIKGTLFERAKTFPGERLHYSFFTNEADNLRIYDHKWFEEVNNPQLLSLFPSNNNQYQKVYGKMPSVSAEAKVKKFQKEISVESNLIGEHIEDVNQIIKSILESEGNPVIIIAHSNKNGRRVIFPDGSFMDIYDIHSECIKALKRCMVLTCFGDDFEIDDKISASDALEIWKAINKKSLEQENLSVNDLITEARIVRIKQKTKKYILISWSITSSFIGLPSLIVSMQDD